MENIILALTKGGMGLDPYVVVGELVEDTDTELTLKKAASPAFTGPTAMLTFQQHLIPMTFMDADCMDNVVTVLRKDYLSFFAVLNSDDPHPLCLEYKRFWDPQPKVDFSASDEPAQPELELLQPEDPSSN